MHIVVHKNNFVHFARRQILISCPPVPLNQASNAETANMPWANADSLGNLGNVFFCW